jgi:hypothetical protein
MVVGRFILRCCRLESMDEMRASLLAESRREVSKIGGTQADE